VRFYEKEKLGPHQSVTPEGFLVCYDVPIARTGTLLYRDGEIVITEPDEDPIEPGPDGIIRAERRAEDLFRVETIASFEGKTVTDDHPPTEISTENWKTYAVGHLQNVRRGNGIEDGLLMGDIVIKEPEAIAAVRDGKREVSPGYRFKCEVLGPGMVRQFNFIGNHVALVDAGRCGPICKIGDSDMTTTTAKAPMSLKNRILSALKVGDNETAEKLVAENVKDQAAESIPAGSGTTINLHMAGAPAEGKDKVESETTQTNGSETEAGALQKIADSISGLSTRMDDFGSRLDKLEGGGAIAGDEKDEGDKDEGAKKAKAGDHIAKDSAGLEPTFQDTIVRAEILAPGIKLIAFDAQAPAKSTGDNLCAFRRRVLDTAYQTEEGKSAIEPMLAGGRLDTKAMTCDGAAMLFIAASENMKRANNDRGAGNGIAMDRSTVKVPTPRDLNEKHRAYWDKRNKS
jgi:hypothetical protein